jgi:tripartite-type tricarboxylate transporter receptor subunit TctC
MTRVDKMNALAVTSRKRLPAYPALPALDESVPGVVAVTWFGMVAPPRTPVAITRKVSQMVSDILKTPEMVRKFSEAGADPVGNSPDEMEKWMREDVERWRTVIRAASIKID